MDQPYLVLTDRSNLNHSSHTGKSKVGLVMHQMKHTQQLILALMGINAPEIDLTLLEDDDDDNGDEIELLGVSNKEHNALLDKIQAMDKTNKSKKAAEKRRMKKEGVEAPQKN